MRILFLDQSGKLGGAELSLLDIATAWHDRCLVGLFQDGDFRVRLEARSIPVQVLMKQGPLAVNKDSGLFKSLGAIGQLWPLVQAVGRLSQDYDVIYANTQKALVVGALASVIARRPLVYHLRDILSIEHFSAANLKVAVTLANFCACRVITNSHATREAFVAAGGRPGIVEVIYNGFDPAQYCATSEQKSAVRKNLAQRDRAQNDLLGQNDRAQKNWDWDDRFIVGHFSRLSPWKGQHVLLEALANCPERVCAIFVGAALFGEDEYAAGLRQQVARLGLADRVQFLGFRADIPELMAACDLVAHTSTAPEPFGRVIVEAMLAGTPVIAAAAGGAVELVETGKTGWLVEPDRPLLLAAQIRDCGGNADRLATVAQRAQIEAMRRFDLDTINLQISAALGQVVKPTGAPELSYS
jgi:glycosyltransferase involved in cell wall biosynthesis